MVRFSDQEFAVETPVSHNKYNHSGFQNNNLFYLFHDQLNYGLAKYFAESETTKSNVNKFLSESLIALLTEKLSYQTADKWIKKLSEILWGIPNDKWIKHKFENKSGVDPIAGQEITIYLRNMLNCLKFLMGHPDFQLNQTYKPSRIYNKNEQQVYKEMHISEW